MESLQTLTERLENLESRVMFQDDLIEKLNLAIIAQQGDIRKLTQLTERLNSQIDNMAQPNIANLSDETPPPHY